MSATWEQKTRPSSRQRSDSEGMFGCTSNTLSVVAKIEQPSKAPEPAAEKRIKSFCERRAKKCSCYTTHRLAALPGCPLFRHDTGTKAHSKAFVQECNPAIFKSQLSLYFQGENLIRGFDFIQTQTELHVHAEDGDRSRRLNSDCGDCLRLSHL